MDRNEEIVRLCGGAGALFLAFAWGTWLLGGVAYLGPRALAEESAPAAGPEKSEKDDPAYQAWKAAEEKKLQRSATWQLERLPDNVIRPDQLEYVGAFNVPKDAGMARGSSDYRLSWSYGAGAACGGLTYCPTGNPDGANKEFPGSLFGTGNEQGQCISEFSIAVPKISKNKDWKELDYAETLQPFATATRGTSAMGGKGSSNCVYSLGYLPRQGAEKWDRIYFSGWHSHTGATEWTRGACSANLSDVTGEGMWRFRDVSGLAGSSAIMEIPKDWADKHCSGMYLAFAGGFGSGYHNSGRGPSVLACAPWKEWKDENPPPPGAILPEATLLMYGNKPETAVRDCQAMDVWEGAAWVMSGTRSALLFFGSKDMGESYWGYARTAEGYRVFLNDGKHGIDAAQFRHIYRDYKGEFHGCHERHKAVIAAGSFQRAEVSRACIYFYNPDDLASVAEGKMKSWEPQYYARLDVSNVLLVMERGVRDLRGCGYDRKNGLLYSLEYCGARDNRPVVHVWRIRKATD